jgi:ketosteroid isomerase-like protein
MTLGGHTISIGWQATFPTISATWCTSRHRDTPLGGARKGKREAIERWAVLLARYEILRYETDDIIIERNRAAVEIPMHYRDRETGTVLETTKANFWTMEDGWPVRLTEYYDLRGAPELLRPRVPTAQA